MEPPPPITVLRAHQQSVTSVCFHKGKLISTSTGNELLVWNLETRRVEQTLSKYKEGDDGLLRACANDNIICANSRLGRLLIFDINTMKPINEIATDQSHGFAGCRLKDTDIFFADAFNGKLCIYDMNSSNWFPISTFKDHGMVMDISVYDNYVGVCLEDSNVIIIDQRNSVEPVWSQSLGRTDPSVSICMLGEERCLVGGSEKSVYDVTPSSHSSFYEMPHAGIDDIAVRSDGRIWALSGWDGRVRLFDAKKKTPLAVLKHHRGGIHTVAFAENDIFASAGDDRGIAVWDLYKRKTSK